MISIIFHHIITCYFNFLIFFNDTCAWTPNKVYSELRREFYASHCLGQVPRASHLSQWRTADQLPIVCQPGCLVVSCLLRFSSQRATRDRWLARATCPSEGPQTNMESCNRHGFTSLVWLCSIDPIVRTYARNLVAHIQSMLHSNLGKLRIYPRLSGAKGVLQKQRMSCKL